MPVLLQYAFDDGEIILYDIWKHPVQETLELLEQIADCTVIGFNLAFDWFQLSKLYTIWLLCDPTWIPEDHIDEIALLEPEGRFGPCIKPRAALDLMLHARKGPFQSLMARDDIRIKRVPSILADALANELESRVEIDGIYFTRRKDKFAPNWKVYDLEDDPDFKDVVLKFAPKGDLKTLAQYALGVKDDVLLRYGDVEIDVALRPEEKGWAPFALAVGKPGKWNWAWPEVIQSHIDHWCYRQDARKYASDDVKYTRGLEQHQAFKDAQPDDDDSVLACMVASVRWRGFPVNLDAMREQRKAAAAKAKGIPVAPKQAAYYINELMSGTEQTILDGSTAKVVLEKVAELECDCVFDTEIKDCKLCNGTKLHPVAVRAKEVLFARKGLKEAELYDKILTAGRFHASFIVIGTLSSRMAGSDGLNPQGINKATAVRQCFTLADPGFVLCGGDFDSFEVVLADAAYNDPKLRAALQQGRSIHGLFGGKLWPELGYEGVMKSKGSSVKDYYTIAKSSVFAMIYGGDHNTLVKKYKVDAEIAEKAYQEFLKDYSEVGKSRAKIFDMFCSMRQPKGIGSRVEWHEPSEYIESLMGFRRYFTLENSICRALFKLAETPPKAWTDIKIKCTRRDRSQFVGGAVRSALFGAAFAIQAAAMRAAANHVIQSSGATITKKLQRNVWDHQPHGVHPWVVVPMNIHDEILCPCKPEIAEAVQKTVYDTIETFRPQVPLIKMEWKIGMKSWAEK
jgi:DNA polymerase family A